MLRSLTALLLAASVTVPALADASKPVCLMTNTIMRTSIKNDQTILFYMNDGAVWQNTLVDKCAGLRMANGFSYEPTTPSYQICDNLVTIRTRDPVNVCLLGAFTPYKPATASP